MEFDYTYTTLFGAQIFEPVTILTNAAIALVCAYAFFQLNKTKTVTAIQWSMFFLLIGLSSIIGSLGHGVHYQLGNSFFKCVEFTMNAISLIAIYYCYQAAHTNYSTEKNKQTKLLRNIVIAWITLLLLITIWFSNFTLIKIHAGIVLSYSLIVHIITHKRKIPGSGWIAFGIAVSFLSILTHSLKIKLSDWFNHKDISHLIMAVSLLLIFKGVQLKVRFIENNLLEDSLNYSEVV
ncbi:MAG: hypothetical protein IM600_14965 [Bacteroidetes bacterium]|nr:hypothetical protein [Bacteroidota bacterium]MCA6444731.1 hypothetical protein [Bacteroidota bacterium]